MTCPLTSHMICIAGQDTHLGLGWLLADCVAQRQPAGEPAGLAKLMNKLANHAEKPMTLWNAHIGKQLT